MYTTKSLKILYVTVMLISNLFLIGVVAKQMRPSCLYYSMALLIASLIINRKILWLDSKYNLTIYLYLAIGSVLFIFFQYPLYLRLPIIVSLIVLCCTLFYTELKLPSEYRLLNFCTYCLAILIFILSFRVGDKFYFQFYSNYNLIIDRFNNALINSLIFSFTPLLIKSLFIVYTAKK